MAVPLPTMEDIARRAGVSKMTVSRSLRNQPAISLATRNRIVKIAKSLGYRLNPILSRFSSHSKREIYHGTIGVIDNFPAENGVFKAKGFRESFRGATERAKELGFKLEVIWIRQPGMNLKRVTTILLARNIQGLLLAPQPEVRSELQIDWERFSVVAFGYTLEKPRFHRVAIHQLRTMEMVLCRLRSAGYRRIGLAIRELYDKRINYNYVGGYLLEHLQFCTKEQLPPLLNFSKQDFFSWHGKHRPDVIIASNGARIVEWARESKIQIPKDLGLVDLASHPSSEDYFSRINFCSFEIGQRAVDLLVGMLNRNERGIPKTPIIHLIEGSWKQGKTTKEKALLVT